MHSKTWTNQLQGSGILLLRKKAKTLKSFDPKTYRFTLSLYSDPKTSPNLPCRFHGDKSLPVVAACDSMSFLLAMELQTDDGL
jgi:hypothetical protein